MNPTVLVIDDEKQIRRLLRLALEEGGYVVKEAENGTLGLQEAVHARPQVIVLDLGLPDLSGVEVLRRLREWNDAPVLILSALDGAQDKVAALEAGADDYVTKPFDTGELLARLAAIRRRSANLDSEPTVKIGELIINVADHRVMRGKMDINLSKTEFAVLAVLLKHRGKVVTQKHLLREVWGPKAEEQAQYIRVYMTHLRQKLEKDPAHPTLIRTETGIGYRLMVDAV
jgi:two-component system KDP operon response regulator KdpE